MVSSVAVLNLLSVISHLLWRGSWNTVEQSVERSGLQCLLIMCDVTVLPKPTFPALTNLFVYGDSL